MTVHFSRDTLRIGLLTTSYPRYAGDVCGDFVAGFAQALAYRGHQVDVLAPDAGAEFELAPHTSGLQSGIRRIPVRYAWPRSRQRLFYGAGAPDNLLRAPWLLPQLMSFAAGLHVAANKYASRWDAVISHWALPCGIVAAMLSQTTRHLAVCHSADVFALCKLPLGRLLRRRMQKHASALWFVAPALRDQFVVPNAPIGGMVHTSPMGFWPTIDDAALAARIARHGKRPLRAVTVSRLVPIKGVSTAIAAIVDSEDLNLVVVGDGPSRAALEVQAAGCSRIRFSGTLTGPEKAKALADADVFLLPSRSLPSGRSEGVPCAMLEAMHAGLPVVASDVGGISSVIQHQRSGLLVPSDDPQALRLAIQRIVCDRDLAIRLGRNARDVASAYTWHELGAKIESLLRGDSSMRLPAESC